MLIIIVITSVRVLYHYLFSHKIDDGEQCKAGHFSATGTEPCLPCEIGTFTASRGGTFCKLCPVGTAAQLTGTGFDSRDL